MLELSQILTQFKEKEENSVKTPQKTERQELIRRFEERINQERQILHLKPLTGAYFAVKLAESGIKTNEDLYWFYSYCDHSRNFGKTWWWALGLSKKEKSL